MAQTVTADATVTINVSDADTSNTIAPGGDVIGYQETVTTNYGASPLPTVAKEWSALLAFVASTPQTLDLTNLPGPRGTTVTFASVRLIYVVNLDGTAGHTITAGGAATPWTPGWSDPANTKPIPSGSRWLEENADTATPWPVGGSAKLLKLDPGANAPTARVIILGS